MENIEIYGDSQVVSDFFDETCAERLKEAVPTLNTSNIRYIARYYRRLKKCPTYGELRLFGELLGEIFSYGYSGEARLVTYECGLHLGRFIYAADAAEDYEKDRRSGSYNPYLLAYGGADLTAENRSSIKRGLLLECSRIEAAINLMPFEGKATIENIIKNIIYLGLVKRIDFLDERKEQ